jgi:hypothetical protein
VRAYLLATGVMLLVYIAFYARYVVWAGDFAWGDRYVSTAAELASFLAVPLLLRHRGEVGRAVRWTGLALVGVSTLIQFASLAFWLPLEIYQMQTLGHPTCVILLRMKNIVAFATGNTKAWGLETPALREDAWDYVHLTTWNFLPCLLRRVGEAPGWVVRTAFLVWGAACAALAAVLVQLRRVLRRSDAAGSAVSESVLHLL